jgi:hypothetical protein
MPLEDALTNPALWDSPGFVLSAETVLVVAGAEQAGGLLSSGARSVGVRTDVPLWTAIGEIPEHDARELGLEILLAAEGQTVFAATRDQAYQLLARGYFVVEIDFQPVGQLGPTTLSEEIHDRLAERRPLTEGRVRFMRSISDSVDSVRIRNTLYFLNYDSNSGAYRSRFAARPELRQDVTPSIADTLTRFVTPHGGTVWNQQYVQKLGGQYVGGDTIFVNVIAEKPGRLTSARYIICAHYDAIAVRQPDWNWRTDPAPGADDNGTGVAVVFECARLLSGVELDVGLTFIAFTGEELGLLGSKHYVETLSGTDSTIAVINIDMVGYQENGPKIQLVHDRQSKWLSDRLDETARLLDIGAAVEAVDLSGLPTSDHASFWVQGIPATMLIEELEREGEDIGGPINPHYHSLGDTLGNTDVGMVADAARLVVALVARFAPVPEDTLPDLVLTDGSIEWDYQGRSYRQPNAGETVEVTVRALNVGASMTESASYDCEVWRGERTYGERVAETWGMVHAAAGEYGEFELTWALDERDYGDLPFTFVVLPEHDDVESDTSNNAIVTTMWVMPAAPVFENLHVYPNPVTEPMNDTLAFEIWHREDAFYGVLDVRVFDVLGNRVGHGVFERSHLKTEIDIGINKICLGQILDGGSGLAPGLYVCYADLTFIGESGRIRQKTRFAVAR